MLTIEAIELKSSLKKYFNINWYFTDSIDYYACYDSIMTIELKSKYGSDFFEKAKYLAKNKGILAGISSGANLAAALKLSEQNPDKLIVTVMCDFGERYLSTELFS